MSTKTRLRTVCDHHLWMSTASNTASGSSLGLQPSPTVPRAPPGPHIGMLLYYAQPGAHWHGTAGAPPAWPLWSLVEPCPPRPQGPCHTCSLSAARAPCLLGSSPVVVALDWGVRVD